MQHKTRGIVLHYIKYGDSSIIAYIYTEQFGRQSYIIKGVHGKKGKIKINIFSPLTILELNVANSHKRELQFINEAHIIFPLQEIPSNIIKSSMALLISEVLYKSLKEEDPNHELFNFLVQNIIELDLTAESLQSFHLYFLMKLTKFLGFFPVNNYDINTEFFDLSEGLFVTRMPEHPYFLDKDIALHFTTLINSIENSTTEKFSKSIRNELFTEILRFYQVHLISLNEIKSYEIIKEVFND